MVGGDVRVSTKYSWRRKRRGGGVVVGNLKKRFENELKHSVYTDGSRSREVSICRVLGFRGSEVRELQNRGILRHKKKKSLPKTDTTGSMRTRESEFVRRKSRRTHRP